MCGIVGYIDWVAAAGARRPGVEAATGRLAHRGPDGAGVVTVADRAAGQPLTAVFGHRRLAIIDLTDDALQPMRDPATENVLCFNGEIYNFAELRVELEAKGRSFRTTSDTEVILGAYAAWGLDALPRFRGIFAFALWDAARRQVVLARDPLGVKPLYVASTATGCVFASEIRALLATGAVERRLDHAAVASFLKYGSVQEPLTLVAGVRSLDAGQAWVFRGGGGPEIRTFWRLEDCLASVPRSDAAAVPDRLADAVRSQLVADVPVGVFLSSGLDSATVAALAAAARPGGIRTFCVGGDDAAQDEREGAAAIARDLGCEHTNLHVGGGEARDQWRRYVADVDQPSLDGLNTYTISQAVRAAGIKVALSGLGADELFLGYNAFAKPRALDRWSGRVRVLPPPLARAAGRLAAAAQPVGASRSSALVQLLADPAHDPYFASRLVFAEPHLAALLTHAAPVVGSAWRDRESALVRAASGQPRLNAISYLELQTYLRSTLLRDADQMSMAHGLEVRVPYLDPVLVAHVLGLSPEAKAAGGSKALLRQTIARHLDWTKHQRAKRGFNLPIELWLRGELGGTVRDSLAAAPSGLWNRDGVRRLWTDFTAGRVTWARVWTVFMLESWLHAHGLTP